MPTDWNKVQQALSPLKSFEEMVKRWQEALAFEFVRSAYNYSLPALLDYTHRCLGKDTRGRFGDYESRLTAILTALQECGVRDVLDLAERTSTRPGLEALADLSGLAAHEIAIALQFLSYWFIPTAKPLSSLVRPGSELEAAIQTLRRQGIRSNLELLQDGRTRLGREQIVESSGLPAAVVEELVQRADLSRLPWASKATISNIIGAGYGSLSRLVDAEPEQLYQDFFRYGAAIGKNLKLGNEIDNSYRIAKLMPRVVEG